MKDQSFSSQLARVLGVHCGIEAKKAGGPDPYDCDGVCLLPEYPLNGDFAFSNDWPVYVRNHVVRLVGSTTFKWSCWVVEDSK